MMDVVSTPCQKARPFVDVPCSNIKHIKSKGSEILNRLVIMAGFIPVYEVDMNEDDFASFKANYEAAKLKGTHLQIVFPKRGEKASKTILYCTNDVLATILGIVYKISEGIKVSYAYVDEKIHIFWNNSKMIFDPKTQIAKMSEELLKNMPPEMIEAMKARGFHIQTIPA